LNIRSSRAARSLGGLAKSAVAAVLAPDLLRQRVIVARTLADAGPLVMVAAIASVVVTAALPTGIVILSGELIGAIPAAVRSGLDSSAGHHLELMVAAVVGAFLTQQIATPLRVVVASEVSQRVTAAIHGRVVDASMAPAGMAHLEEPAVQDLLDRARGGGTARVPPGAAAEALLTVCERRLEGWLLIAVVASFNLWVAAMLAVELLVTYQLYRRGLSAFTERFVARGERFRRAGYMRSLGFSAEAGKEIRTFGLSGWVTSQFTALFSDALHGIWDRRRREVLIQTAPSVLDAVAVGVALAVLGVAAAHGQVSLGRLMTVAGAVLGTIVLTDLGNEDLRMAWGLQAIRAAADLEADLLSRAGAQEGGIEAEGLPRVGLRFEAVTFGYPGGPPILQDFDLTIPAGRSLAIVGVNGAGKTTIVKLLARLYDPAAGRITVDGIDLRDLDPQRWQRRIAAIFQDFVHFEAFSLADNIGFGAIEEPANREALERAASAAGLDGVASNLPDGWETRLSRQYRSGAELSGGQWQRVALARALLATEAGAGVLVLDEPTASLDVSGEAAMYDRFLELTRGVTTIVISHRFSTVRRADAIVVLDGGTVTEQGTHQELVQRGGTYAQMFQAQASRYEDRDLPEVCEKVTVDD
jgi:ATP-binding cassette subfamily B protein